VVRNGEEEIDGIALVDFYRPREEVGVFEDLWLHAGWRGGLAVGIELLIRGIGVVDTDREGLRGCRRSSDGHTHPDHG
jgi:hypothetical protein